MSVCEVIELPSGLTSLAIPERSTPCAVYLIKAVGLGLVYVGIADDFDKRLAQHRRQSWWMGEVVIDEIDVHWMFCRDHARQMEAAIIRRSAPRYNTALELGALKRYDEAAATQVDDPWPVAVSECYDSEGSLVWASR